MAGSFSVVGREPKSEDQASSSCVEVPACEAPSTTRWNHLIINNNNNKSTIQSRKRIIHYTTNYTRTPNCTARMHLDNPMNLSLIHVPRPPHKNRRQKLNETPPSHITLQLLIMFWSPPVSPPCCCPGWGIALCFIMKFLIMTYTLLKTGTFMAYGEMVASNFRKASFVYGFNWYLIFIQFQYTNSMIKLR